jgi:hypothetical protein
MGVASFRAELMTAAADSAAKVVGLMSMKAGASNAIRHDTFVTLAMPAE